MTVAIRTYEPRDHDRVWEMHLEGVRDARTQYPDVDNSGYEDDLRNIERDYLSSGSNFWVAEADGRLIGMVAAQRIDDNTGRLRRMRVTHGWRRKGVATRLLSTVEQFCRHHSYARLILDTTEQQTAAHSLYERAGFTRTGERTLGPFRIFDYEKSLT
jgi:GNAT superfamily N-acetyltransferase